MSFGISITNGSHESVAGGGWASNQQARGIEQSVAIRLRHISVVGIGTDGA